MEEKKNTKMTPERRKQIDNFLLKSYSRFNFRLHKVIDKEIIEKLESVESKTGYIKELIRKDIKSKKRR